MFSLQKPLKSIKLFSEKSRAAFLAARFLLVFLSKCMGDPMWSPVFFGGSTPRVLLRFAHGAATALRFKNKNNKTTVGNGLDLSDLPSQRGRWIFCNLLQKRRMRDFFLIFTPISLTAQRNGGKTAKETPSNPCSLLPQTLSPYIRGLKCTTGRKCFLIPTAIVQADGGFLFRFFARPICFD